MQRYHKNLFINIKSYDMQVLKKYFEYLEYEGTLIT